MSTRTTIAATLAELRPDDLYAAWRRADLMEDRGEIAADEARWWKVGVYGLMQAWDLSPHEVLGLVRGKNWSDLEASPFLVTRRAFS